MIKNEILKELKALIDPFSFNFDGSQFIIIGKAADILNGKDDPTMENIEIWVNPKYYDIIASSEEYVETTIEDGHFTRNISFTYIYYEKKYGVIKLYRGDVIGPKPKFRKIEGCNVQIPIQESDTARILNFHSKERTT